MPKIISESYLIKSSLFSLLLTFIISFSQAQNQYELTGGWKCAAVSKIPNNGTVISTTAYSTADWMPAVVPGTVLTTLLAKKQVPDPFYGMNNEQIPDIYKTGRDYYTYWFVTDFKEEYPKKNQQIWLNFRGINYSCEVYLNGNKVNASRHFGMFLRQSYNITPFLEKDGNNRLAVIVYPPDPVGNPNGGQGGDGTIARNVTHQYVAGWDWIQPVRDRNTGIWDKVYIEKTFSVNLKNSHITTIVPGKRNPDGLQAPAIIKTSAEVENTTDHTVEGTLQYILKGNKISKKVLLPPHITSIILLPDFSLNNPKLWWPHGYGTQHLYELKLQFILNDNTVTDEESISVGVRQIKTEWNTVTQSRQILVNGQKIFIKGGNWIISDAMLRFSKERYDAEIRFHQDMNLNLIRIWGGALIERPEFYHACDKYGLLVIQDFWMSGDCNGRWLDPLKLDDQWTRRKYPDNHHLFLESARDQIKMIRNHPSLAIWCGGNEITPPEDILVSLQDSILPELDGTRWFVEYSNSDSMSFNSLGGVGDGPYGIQPVNKFWEYRTFPFNSEIGSVGVGDYESLERFIPQENMTAPEYPSKVDPVWNYHKYIGYDQYIKPYGDPLNARDFTKKAQLVNYDQYRALAEGFSAHMWEWYTGVIIWKTQNPWTALRGQMYDYYLDPNGCLYGLRNGSEPLHIMVNPVDGMVMIANNTFEAKRNMMLVIKTYDMQGEDSLITQVFVNIEPTSTKKYLSIKEALDKLGKDQGVFLSLQLLDQNKKLLSDNFYWFPDSKGIYSGLQKLPSSSLQVEASLIEKGKIEVKLSNPAKSSVAFFNRLSLINPQTKKRILPTFYSDNYLSVLPGTEKKVVLEYTSETNTSMPQILISGWNVKDQFVEIRDK